jgi:hypothetical protein
VILDALYIATAALVAIALSLHISLAPKKPVPKEPYFLACYSDVCFS